MLPGQGICKFLPPVVYSRHTNQDLCALLSRNQRAFCKEAPHDLERT